MAIHVRTDYYWIDVPEAYQNRATDLAYIAGLAKRLNRMDLYNQAENAYMELSKRWDQEGHALAKKKRSINWLGGGSEYMVHSMMPWDFCYKLGEAIAEEMSLEECASELKKALLDL